MGKKITTPSVKAEKTPKEVPPPQNVTLSEKAEKKSYSAVREGHDPFNGIVQLLFNGTTWKVNTRKGSSAPIRTEAAADLAFETAIADGQF